MNHEFNNVNKWLKDLIHDIIYPHVDVFYNVKCCPYYYINRYFNWLWLKCWYHVSPCRWAINVRIPTVFYGSFGLFGPDRLVVDDDNWSILLRIFLDLGCIRQPKCWHGTEFIIGNGCIIPPCVPKNLMEQFRQGLVYVINCDSFSSSD